MTSSQLRLGLIWTRNSTVSTAIALWVFLIPYGVGWGVGSIPGPVVVLVLGAFGGAIVGAGQWSALRRIVPGIPARSWVTATVYGVLLACALGLLSMVARLDALLPGTPSLTLLPTASALVLAVAFGAVMGPILAGFQWRLLRATVPHAGWWLVANGAAWTLAMPIVIATLAARPRTPTDWIAASGVLGLAGALAGALQGVALQWMVQPRKGTVPV
jgi:hypothetical protein